jgi:hypothetical protein
MMGDKNQARATATKYGIPVTPGSDGIVETEEEALKVAEKDRLPGHDQGHRRRWRTRDAPCVEQGELCERLSRGPE